MKPSDTGHESGECVALLLRPYDVKRDFSQFNVLGVKGGDKTVEFGGAEGRSHGSTKLDRTKNLQAKVQVRCIWGLWVEAQEKIQSAMMGQLLVGNLGLLCFRRNFPYY